MSEKEKDAVEELKKELRLAINIDDVTTTIRNGYAQIILNLIERLLKKNEELENDISNMYNKEVIISIMCDEFNLSRGEALRLLGGE